MPDRGYPILRGRVVPRGEPLAKFLPKAKLGHYESNGGIAKSRKGLLFLKNAFEICAIFARNLRGHISAKNFKKRDNSTVLITVPWGD